RIHRKQLFDRTPRDRTRRMVWWIAKRVEHHHAVGDRRIDAPETVLAVEPLVHPGYCQSRSTLARALGKQRLNGVQNVVDDAEEPKPPRLLMRRLQRRAQSLRWFQKKFVDADL